MGENVSGRAKIPPPKKSFFWSSDSFDQDYSLLGLLGTAVHVFGVVGARAAQVQKAEARLQAEALLGAGGGAAVAVVVGGGGGGGRGRSIVQIPLCTFCPVTCSTEEGQ